MTEREDGVIEVRPLVAVPASQASFWSEDWQAREREVDVHLARSEFTDHGDVDAFLGRLDVLDGPQGDPAAGVTAASAGQVEDGGVGSER